jgi:hypothetical protein
MHVVNLSLNHPMFNLVTLFRIRNVNIIEYKTHISMYETLLCLIFPSFYGRIEHGSCCL